MYEAYWQLAAKPFENTVETEFYYPSQTHQSALLKLRYVMENRRGAALLSGAGGLGKSLLVQSLFRLLPANMAPRVHLVFPQLPTDELLAYIADALTGEHPAATTHPQVSVRRIQDALAENARAERHAILAIDEAHLLADSPSLETMRLLLNFETDGQPGLTLLLVGQSALLPAINRIPSLEERLAVKCLLRPFTVEETVSYISHRLTAAGNKQAIFAGEAMEMVHELSGGVPRRINRLCDLALLMGYAEEQDVIGVSQIEAVSEELIAVAPE
jgi:general secretion pathway protein A